MSAAMSLSAAKRTKPSRGGGRAAASPVDAGDMLQRRRSARREEETRTCHAKGESRRASRLASRNTNTNIEPMCPTAQPEID